MQSKPRGNFGVNEKNYFNVWSLFFLRKGWWKYIYVSAEADGLDLNVIALRMQTYTENLFRRRHPDFWKK